MSSITSPLPPESFHLCGIRKIKSAANLRPPNSFPGEVYGPRVFNCLGLLYGCGLAGAGNSRLVGAVLGHDLLHARLGVTVMARFSGRKQGFGRHLKPYKQGLDRLNTRRAALPPRNDPPSRQKALFRAVESPSIRCTGKPAARRCRHR
jgi:hypothetical protein